MSWICSVEASIPVFVSGLAILAYPDNRAISNRVCPDALCPCHFPCPAFEGAMEVTTPAVVDAVIQVVIEDARRHIKYEWIVFNNYVAYNRNLIFARRDLAFMSPGVTNLSSFPQIIAIFCSRIGRAVFNFKRLLTFTVITINGRQADMFTINNWWLSIITLIPVIRQTTKENIIWSWNWNIIIYKLHRFSLHNKKVAMAIVLLLFCCSWKLNYRE